MQRLRLLVERLVNSRYMLWGVALASFLESIIVPIPLEAILVPLMQARRDKLWLISFMALLGCVLGATVGYLFGYFLFDWLGEYVIELFSSQQQFDYVRNAMQDNGFWFVFSVGVVPIPFQIAMLAAGATAYAFSLYLLATILSRSIRYFGLGILVWLFGNQAQRLFERNKIKASLLLLAVVMVIWVAIFVLR